MKKVKILSICLFILILVTFGYLNSKGVILLPHNKKKIVNNLAKTVLHYYVIEEHAIAMAALIEENLKGGKYIFVFFPEQLWKVLNTDLRSVSNDKHIMFVSSPDMVEYAKNRIKNIDIENERDREESAQDNHGIAEVKMISDDIGYIKLTRFSNPIYGKETLMQAMQTIEDASSVIIDLRNNNGGFLEQVQVLFSYFTSQKEPVLIISQYFRYNDSTLEFWTLNDIPGKKFDRDEVYVLTSSATFSAAEAFAYSMKHHQKAVILGETTRGGAHSVDWKILCDRYVLRVPVGRGLHPVTGKDWEGTGVTPDVSVPASSALEQALLLIKDK